MIYATVTLIIVMILSSSYGKIKQGNALPIIGSVLSLCIFSSCRSVSFGPDLTYYATQYTRVIPFLDYIEIIRQYTSGLMKDGIFYIFMKLCIEIGLSYQAFISIVTSFYIVTVSWMISRYSKCPILSFMMFISLSWLQFSFTGLRQAMAMGCCSLAIGILASNKRPLLALVLILIAGLFHTSGFTFLFAFVVYKLKFKITPIRFVVLILSSVAMALWGSVVFRKIVTMIAWNETLAYYATSSVSLNWTGFLIQLTISCFSFYMYRDVVDEHPEMNLFYTLMAIGTAFQAFAGIIAEMFRISMYFSIASICVFPVAIQAIKNDQWRKAAFYGSIVILFAYFIAGNKFAMYVPITA